MAAGQLLDLARMVVSVGGTGTLTLSGAAPGYLTFTQAGSADASIYSYGIIDGSASEVGSATMGGSGTTLSSRTVDKSTNSNAAINVSVGAQVFICARRENILSFAESMTWLTATEQAQARANLYAAPFDALAYNGMQVNGSMEVSQQSGAALSSGITNAVPYAVDCVKALALGTTHVIKYQQVVDAPDGFTNSVKLTVTTANPSPAAGDAVGFSIPIEGVRILRLAFGTASAQSLTIGFWVKAHRTGTYSGSITNNANDRSYPFSFAVSASDTWEFKTVTIPGDTSGTWLTDTSIGMFVVFSMMAGTTFTATANTWGAGLKLGATGTINGVAATTDTFQITGVIVLPGTEAPSSTRSALIMRNLSEEYDLCQRYYGTTLYTYSIVPGTNVGAGGGGIYSSVAGGNFDGSFSFKKTMRTPPTLTLYDNAGNSGAISYYDGSWHNSAAPPNLVSSIKGLAWQGGIVANFVNFDAVADARL